MQEHDEKYIQNAPHWLIIIFWGGSPSPDVRSLKGITSPPPPASPIVRWADLMLFSRSTPLGLRSEPEELPAFVRCNVIRVIIVGTRLSQGSVQSRIRSSM